MTSPDTPKNCRIGKVLKARDFRNNRLWHCDTSGELTTQVNGKTFTEEEFDNKYPVPNPVNYYLAKENPDKTRDYLK